MASQSEWAQYEKEILSRLDLVAEWRRLGLRIKGSETPNARGWISCHSLTREDANASAGILVQGEAAGCYNDFAMGAAGKTNLFRYAATKTNHGDWRKIRDAYAESLGIKKPGDTEKSTARWSMDRFEPTTGGGLPTKGQLSLYVDEKPGVTTQSLLDVGAIAGRFPRNWRPQSSQSHCFAFPMFNSESLHEGEPCGLHLVSIDPRKKVRIPQKKGEQPKEVKSVSLGNVGILGLRSLQQLEDADVVWWVEGISDLLAATAIIPRDGKHIALSLTGCKARINEKILHKFSGKTHYVCYDVGDADNAGQDGARIQCGIMSAVAREVRNVVLPPGKDGKNDLRAWIVEGNRTYEDMLALARVSSVWGSGSSSLLASESNGSVLEATSPQQALLDMLGCVVNGQVEGTNHVEIHSMRTGQRMVVKSLNSFSLHEAVMMFGADVALTVISQSRDVEPGKFSMSDVRVAIAAAACGKTVCEEDSLGSGVWEIGGDLVLVGKGVACKYTRDRRFEKLKKPLYGGKRFDYSKGREWFDAESMGSMLNEAKNPKWRKGVVKELISLFKMWDNWEHESNAEVAAGLVLATWVQSLWSFRPQVLVSGPSSSGKSTFTKAAFSGVFNGLSLAISKPTEAGLRQEIGNSAPAVSIDEFDRCDQKTQILELIRTSTDSSVISKGSANGVSKRYAMRHICWISGIESGITEEADQNRFIRLGLTKIASGRKNNKRLVLPNMLALKDLGHRLSAVAIYSSFEAREFAEAISSQANPDGVALRYTQAMSAPAAMLGVNMGWSVEDVSTWVEQLMGERQIAEKQTHDEEELIASIQSSKTSEAGRQFTISSLIEAVMKNVGTMEMTFDSENSVRAIDADRMLQANGIKVLRDEGMLFIHPGNVSRFLLQNTRFAKSAISDILDRIEGASRLYCKVSGHTKRGIAVPISRLFSAD